MQKPWPPFEELVRDLSSPNRYKRIRAAQGLGEGRDPRAVAPLLQALTDLAGDVRAKAVVALGKFRDPQALGPLIEAMRDDKVSVRSGAIGAVKKFGKRAYQPLLEAYKGATGPFRAALLEALAHYKTPAVSELLIAALADKSLHLQAVRFLGRRKDKRAIEPLLAALAEAKAWLDQFNKDWEDGTTATPGYADPWRDLAPRFQLVVWALGEIRDPRAFGPLQEQLAVNQSSILAGFMTDIVTALRKIDNARAVDLLHGQLNDPSNPDKDRLSLSLAGMDLMNATQALRTTAKNGDLSVLWQALQAAGATQRQLLASNQEVGKDPAEVSQNHTDLMRHLESMLRGLARGEQGG